MATIKKTPMRVTSAMVNAAGKLRKFPQCMGQANWPMVETVYEDGTISIDYAGDPVFSAYQVAEYVRKYCELNHLKAA